MAGYRTIPTKDTTDVDEKLGGVVTVRQLAYLLLTFILTYIAYTIADEVFNGSSDSIYLWGPVLFLCLLFTFSDVDKWASIRAKYYFSSNHARLESNPSLLRNVRSEEEDKIVTLDGRVIAVLKITPINFPLLSDEAKEAKIASYEMYLRQLVYPIMHMVHSDEVELDEYFGRVIKDASFAKAKGVLDIEKYARSHIMFLKKYLKKSKSRTKNHYVVLQVQDPRYKTRAHEPRQTIAGSIKLGLDVFLAEFSANALLSGKNAFAKPANYVRIDAPGKRMIFADARLLPPQAPSRSQKLGQMLQFDSIVALLRYAKSQKGRLYYGAIDLDLLIEKEFRDMPLREREEEFSIEERRKHVGLSGGKTRWAYDEAEKHISVLSDKLEAAGLRVRRVRGQELYGGRHMNLTRADKVRISPEYVHVDNTYMKVIEATGYPYQVSLGWLSNIVDGREDYDFTMYVYPMGIQQALSAFRNARLKLNTEKKARGDFLDPESEQHLEDITNFYTNIVSGKEKYFKASLYVTAKAPSLKSLDTVVEKCKSDLAGASIDYSPADFNMARAVYSTRLTGYDLIGKKREFPSSSLAASFPHISSSLEVDNEGMLFAFDWMDTPIIMDLRKLPNQHISILGESGSGKSYFAKSIIPRYLLSGYQVFVTDPDGEYVRLAKNLGGTISSVGPKFGTCINPFDLQGRDVNDKIRGLLGLFSIVCGQLNKYQEGIITDVLVELFEKAKERQVIMSDFSKALQHRFKGTRDEQLRHDIQFILISIRPFLSGNLYGFIDKKTSVKMGGRLHVFDLREYQNDKTLRDFFNYLIFDFISHRLLTDKSLKALFMDEGWTMVNYPGAEDYVRYIIKDSRKYNVSFVFITQELEDMLSSDAGRSVLNNTSTQFIFHEKESAMALMQKTLSLTSVEYEKLITCSKGQGLMVSDKTRLFFKVETSKDEHEIITTDPNAPKKEEKKIRSRAKTEREEFLPPPLYAALHESRSELAKTIGLSSGQKGKTADSSGDAEIKQAEKRKADVEGDPDASAKDVAGVEGQMRLADIGINLPDMKKLLPIALTHGLVSEKEKQIIAKALSRKEKKKSSSQKAKKAPKKKGKKPVSKKSAKKRKK